MALTLKNINPSGSNSGAGPKFYTYSTVDSLATVAGSNYFDNASSVLQTGGILAVVSSAVSGGGVRLYKLTVASGVVTVAAVSGVAGDQIAAQAALTDNSGGTGSETLAVIAMPADTPASADALRDDLVANALPAIKNAIASLAAKQNAIIAAMKASGAMASS